MNPSAVANGDLREIAKFIERTEFEHIGHVGGGQGMFLASAIVRELRIHGLVESGYREYCASLPPDVRPISFQGFLNVYQEIVVQALDFMRLDHELRSVRLKESGA